MAISSPGIGSGLDINGIVTQLMNVEKQSVTKLDTKEATLQARISAYGSLKSALASFQSAASALAGSAKFTSSKATVTDTTVLSAGGGASAVPGSYSVEVTALAQAHKIKSTAFAGTAATVGTGTLTIAFGTYDSIGNTFTVNPDKPATSITIDSSKSSLAGIRDTINAANAGVTASIVNDGTGNRLVLSSNATGAANSIKVTVTADGDANNTDNAGLSQLAYDPTAATGSGKNMTQTVAAVNAAVVIDGMTVSKASNTIDDAIEGVTLNLVKTNVDEPVTLTIARDTAGARAGIETFVKAYNDLNKTITDLSKYDAANKRASVLTGDATLRTVQSRLRAVLSAPLDSAGGGYTRLSEIGVTFQKDGTLALDTGKLDAALKDTTKDVSTLFAAVGKPTDSLLTFAGSSRETRDGSYAVNITQLGTQGKATGSVTAALTITAGVNDTLAVTVDGAAASITLTAGTYTAAGLAAEIQARLNGANELIAAGSKVTASAASGVLTITSNRYGSASSVLIGGGTALTDLFGSPQQTDGVDVAGTIDGAVATGSGQTLTATVGNAIGLKLTVLGGASGDRGKVNYAQGYAFKLEAAASGMLASDGMVASRTNGLNASVKDIDSQREVLNRRLAELEKRYRAQYTALDAAIASMNRTSAYLTQQLASLPKSES
ncbi:MAG: flagellar filament capping protein FliD [Rhodospirillaceae bacterium]